MTTELAVFDQIKAGITGLSMELAALFISFVDGGDIRHMKIVY